MDPIRGPPTAGGVEAAAAPPPRNANGSTSTDDSAAGLGTGTGDGQGRKKRARETRSIASLAAASAPPAASASSAAAAASSHAPHVDALAHIDLVVYAGYEIRAQYPSPYPLEELPGTPAASTSTASGAAANNNNAATQMRENGGRFGGKKAAPNATSTASTTVPISENDNDGGKAPNGADGPTPPPSRGSTEFSTHGTETAAGREISPELAAPATAVAAPPPPVGAMPMQIDIASTPLDGGEFAAASMTPQLVAAPDSVAVAETPTPSPLETIPPPAPLPPPPSAAGTATASGAPPIASTSAALSYPTQPTPPVPTSRGSRGRFLPKPPGETVKAKRAAERAARLAAGKDASSPNAHGEGYLTQRQQRELARKAREERERELREKQKLLPPTEVKLFVCDRCFKYMALPAAYLAHQKECQITKPPGRRVYQRGATSIWEIDGAQAKLYCQNLCLFAKLFIEHKYMFFDVESFTFYLLTEAMGKQEWVLGYFSKEKISYDDYNLACIVVFPPFRQRGWATLLIEFSYELSRRYSATPGTPERPLSELGQRGYLAYWISLLVRYFRAVFALRDRPPLIDKVISAPGRVSVSPAKNSQADDADDVDEADRLERERKKRLRRSKGWDGELPSGGNLLAKSPAKAFTLRPLPSVVEAHVASPNGGGGEGTSSVEVVDGEEVFSFATGLDELAHAVNLRPDDVAYALVESGLARWRSRGVAAATEQLQAENEVETNGVAVAVVGDGDTKMEEDGTTAKLQAVAVSSTATATPPPSVGGRPPLQEAATVDQELELIITPELVEEVARQKGVKPMPMLDVAYVCGL